MNIRIRDFSYYCPCRGGNGDTYWAAVEHRQVANGWELSYSDSSEFRLCSVTGRYDECDQCRDNWDGECVAVPDVIDDTVFKVALEEALVNPCQEIAILVGDEWIIVKQAQERYTPEPCTCYDTGGENENC